MLTLTPVIRVIERMDMPSTNIEKICARLAVGSLFMREIFPHADLYGKDSCHFVYGISSPTA